MRGKSIIYKLVALIFQDRVNILFGPVNEIDGGGRKGGNGKVTNKVLGDMRLINRPDLGRISDFFWGESFFLEGEFSMTLGEYLMRGGCFS